MSQNKTGPDQIEKVALRLSDSDKLTLLKKISKTVNTKTFKLPKKSCTKCYGRGYVGFLNGIPSLKVPCRCTFIKTKMGK